MNREHHAVAESIVGHGDPLAVMQQAGLDHLSGLDALGRQRVAQRETLRRAIAQAELALRRRIEPAIREIATGLRPDWIVQGRLKDPRGERQRVMQGGAPLVRASPSGVRRGIGSPAIPASRSTASGKPRPSTSTRNVKISPLLPDEKS